MARIVIPGGTGYLGRQLSRRLVERGDEVIVLTRGPGGVRDGVRLVQWDGATLGPWTQALEGADAIVHLAGRRVDCRPTRRNVNELISSRVDSVLLMGQALERCESSPPVWVQCATMAIYGEAGERVIDEEVVPDGLGPRQMTGVALAWEAAFHHATRRVARPVLLRMGIVLGADDPARARLGAILRLGLGGPIAGGRRWVSWIGLEDALRVLIRAIDEPAMRGLYHATAPEPVRNARFMAALRAAHGARFGLPAPAAVAWFGAWMVGSDPALALTGRRGVPRRLQREGFTFLHPQIEEALGLGAPPGPGADDARQRPRAAA